MHLHLIFSEHSLLKAEIESVKFMLKIDSSHSKERHTKLHLSQSKEKFWSHSHSLNLHIESERFILILIPVYITSLVSKLGSTIILSINIVYLALIVVAAVNNRYGTIAEM